MASKEELARLDYDAAMLRQLTREPGWLILSRQLATAEAMILNDLKSDAPNRSHSDDWYKGYLASIEVLRTTPEKIIALAESLKS